MDSFCKKKKKLAELFSILFITFDSTFDTLISFFIFFQDSCENAFDSPLMYSNGWGKKLTYVVACSRNDVVVSENFNLCFGNHKNIYTVNLT